MLCIEGKSSEEENKVRVSAIHDLKEKLKSENEELKKIKYKLKEVQEKQKAEKEVRVTGNRRVILELAVFLNLRTGKHHVVDL